jgi:hypothetical protein
MSNIETKRKKETERENRHSKKET